MNLFQLGNFTLHSGEEANWKIECDALTDEDWETFAFMINRWFSERAFDFHEVIGVPRGGLKLAEKLQKYVIPGGLFRLIVDDVYTTGKSISEYQLHSHDVGFVVFARNAIKQPWVYALCQFNN
jgi:orotate phosphoribosyltransferase